MHPARLIITRPVPGSGVGSNLANLACAIYFASKSNAAVAVDWTGMEELRDKSLNMFARFFETPEQIAGVPMYYRVHAARGLPEAVFTEATELRTTAESFRYLAGGFAAETGKAVRLSVYHGLDRVRQLAPESLGSAWDDQRHLAQVYAAIRPEPGLAGRIHDWAAANLGDHFVVGVNVRAGNGLFDRGSLYRLRVNAHVFSSKTFFLNGLRRAIKDRLAELPDPVRGEAKVFFATDTQAMSEWLRQMPGFVTRRTQFPPPGVGHAWADYTQSDYTDIDAMEDVLADMFLLSRCQALVYNGTTFNLHARIVTRYFSGNMVNIERYYPLTTFLVNIERAKGAAQALLRRILARFSR